MSRCVEVCAQTNPPAEARTRARVDLLRLLAPSQPTQTTPPDEGMEEKDNGEENRQNNSGLYPRVAYLYGIIHPHTLELLSLPAAVHKSHPSFRLLGYFLVNKKHVY